MLQFFPQGLPADPQDSRRLGAIALRKVKHGDDVLPLRLFPHLAERPVLDPEKRIFQLAHDLSHLGRHRMNAHASDNDTGSRATCSDGQVTRDP